MYEQIASNVRRTYIVIFFFILLIVLMGYAFAEWTGTPELLPLAVIFAIVTSVGSYYHSDRIVLAMSHARPATREQHAYLVNSIEGLAIAAGLPTPKLYIIDDTAPNAFATGRDPEHAVICVTTGLIQKLNRLEIEGVLAHEMAHIKAYDIRLMALVAVLAGTVVLLADWMRKSMWWGGGRGRRLRGICHPVIMIVVLIAVLFAPLIATLMRLALSRRREYLADAQGALLTRYPEGLASALEKIAADPEPLEVANKATAHMYVYNPLRDYGGWLNSLFSTHPPIEDRIRRLREM